MSPVRKRPPFEWLARDMLEKIERQKLHHRQSLPGLTPDEVRAEMLEALWRAWQTYSASTGVPIEKYFWRVWINRKSDLITFYYRQRRDHTKELLSPFPEVWWAHGHQDFNTGEITPMDDEHHVTESGPRARRVHKGTEATEELIAPQPPPNTGVLARKMWLLLAQGHTRQDVLSLLSITKRTYYEIIDEWRGKGVAIILG